MKNGFARIAALGLMALPLVGCASIFAGGSPGLHVFVDDQNVQGVTVTVTGLQNGDRFVEHATDFEIYLQRNSDYLIEARAPGYETEQIEVGRSVNPVTFVNVLFWPGFLIDLADGAFWQPDREVVQIHLSRQLGSSDEGMLSLAVDAPEIGLHKVVALRR